MITALRAALVLPLIAAAISSSQRVNVGTATRSGTRWSSPMTQQHGQSMRRNLHRSLSKALATTKNKQPGSWQISPQDRSSSSSSSNSRLVKSSSAIATPPTNAGVKEANLKVFGYDVTRFGVYFMAHALVYGILWYLSLIKWVILSFIDKDHHNMDRSSLLWATRTLKSTGCMPIIEGWENLPKEHGGTMEDDGKPLMIVANHASWMDVPVIRQITKRCKFLAKKDLGLVPILGPSLRWGDHPLVDRSDKRSTVKSFRQGVDWLKKGVSLVTFPEGTRSVDGRFSSAEALKGGAFKMAIYSGARVVPVSIAGTYDIMPKSALLPLRPSDGRLHVKIHAPIETHKGMSEEELAAETHKMISSGLPPSQQPLQ
mmetsp:Transcript_5789/g.7696  ORF Transcript_5789/g.7696 Transcript_5789/m.7696 type:complete len:372 (+) Transcript_5789:2-1117(+)